jgi:hypothetical protein
LLPRAAFSAAVEVAVVGGGSITAGGSKRGWTIIVAWGQRRLSCSCCGIG